MPKFIPSLLVARPRRDARLDQLDDRLRADMGLPRDKSRHAQSFLLGALVGRSG